MGPGLGLGRLGQAGVGAGSVLAGSGRRGGGIRGVTLARGEVRALRPVTGLGFHSCPLIDVSAGDLVRGLFDLIVIWRCLVAVRDGANGAFSGGFNPSGQITRIAPMQPGRA